MSLDSADEAVLLRCTWYSALSKNDNEGEKQQQEETALLDNIDCMQKVLAQSIILWFVNLFLVFFLRPGVFSRHPVRDLEKALSPGAPPPQASGKRVKVTKEVQAKKEVFCNQFLTTSGSGGSAQPSSTTLPKVRDNSGLG